MLGASARTDVAWPTRKIEVSRPSRMTALNASRARPNAVPSVRVRSIRACSSPRSAFDCRSIQNSIQVTAAAATRSAVASKYCS